MENIHIIELSKYTSPSIVEDKHREWVNYGEDNNYFGYLIDRFNGSTTNMAIIKGMTKMIYGKGLDATDSNRKPEQYAQMKSLISKDCLKAAIMDRKILGMAAFKISYENKKVKSITHWPMHTLRAEKANEDGDIEAWYYHPKWEEYKNSDQPKRISSFGFGNQKSNEILIVKPYVTGFDYYPPVDYQGALPYAVLEEEIADYLINDTINGFSGTKVVNFNNGVPDKAKQRQVKGDVINKLTGAKGEKTIVAFNNNAESKTTIDNIPLDNAPEHYRYLSEEAFTKLLVGHGVTSPMLLGVRDGGNGLGNNADEIKTATLLFDNLSIRTYQDEFLDALDKPFSVNKISLKTYIKTIQPLEFTDVDGLDKETKEEETGIKMNEHFSCSAESHENDEKIAQELIDLGEDENLDEWELISSEDVNYEEEELEENQSLLSKIWNFVSTGTATPNSKSKQDKVIDGIPYKVRYRYSPLKASSNSREFCRRMVAADKLYRKEDIISMGNKTVNAGWGPNGANTYSIWKYKGGGACHHKWLRQTFKGKTQGNLANQDANISTNKARKDGFNPVNEKEVSMKPIDMPNSGFLKPRG
jgi:hypothetical protein